MIVTFLERWLAVAGTCAVLLLPETGAPLLPIELMAGGVLP